MKKIIESFKNLKKVTWLSKTAAFQATGWIILVLLVFGFLSNYLDLVMQALLSKIL
ncbi:preprotein translocase subunit SecE [Latilactobacillus sakei]|uniref:preprotein translocase subunit SecE n=1 Tax=Latilactobacillus sakei TaxID=1599 RepID=UPI00202E28A5|nr:preprotein translocase subunit SecE [Latilactobacillus sakei]MCM1636539.1 preprotein translocase subunit SecE [Latilactobacillus sakei]